MLVTDRTFAASAELVDRDPDIVVDLETNGLRPWQGDRACGVAVEAGGKAMYFPFRHEGGGNLHESQLPKLKKAIRQGKKTLRGWNLRFDLSTMSYEDDDDGWIGPDVTMRDGIIDALLMNENEPSFSLEAIATKYLGRAAAGSKGDMDALLRERFPKIKSKKALKGNLWRLPASDVEPYACGDVSLPRQLAVKYGKALEQWGLTSLAGEMNHYSLLLARMQRYGIFIDREYCERLSATTEDRKAELLTKLRGIIGPTFNPNSWQQVSRYFGTENAQEETLLRCGNPDGQYVIDFKKLGKAKSSYYDKILDLLGPDGILHPQLNLTAGPSDKGGTKTGRLSCSDPNFQALPHADDDPNGIYKVRDLVIARPGMKLAKFDYQRAEMWVGGHYSRDVSLFQAYHAGRDLYVELAQKTGIRRQDAKILWLMIQYGAGVWKIAQTFGWDLAKAQEVKDAFFELCPGIRRAMYAYADKAEGCGVLRLWTGRVRHFDGVTSRYYSAWNGLVQGAVGEMVRLAMMRAEPELNRLGAHMILQVHDELVVEYPEENEREVLSVMCRIMTDFDFKLRPRVEPKVGTNYAKLIDYKEAA